MCVAIASLSDYMPCLCVVFFTPNCLALKCLLCTWSSHWFPFT